MTTTASKPKLPPFESNDVATARVRITRAGDGLSEALKVEPRAIQLGESVYYLLRGECVQVNHVEKDDTLTRVHTIAADQVVEVPEDTAQELLRRGAEELERKKAAADGQTSIDDELAAQQREAADGTTAAADVAKDSAERVKAGK